MKIERDHMNKEKLEKLFADDLGTSYFPILAEKYLNDGDYNRALQVLNTGLVINPNNNDGKYVKAKISMLNSDTKIGVKLLKEIIQSDGLYINAMKMLALHYQSTGYNNKSLVNILNKIIDLVPGDKFSLDMMRSIKKPKNKSKKFKSRKISTKKTSSKKITKKNKSPQKNTQSERPARKGMPLNSVNAKMATLTFVDILIKQDQFNQASQLLKIIEKRKSVSKESISQREKKIKKGLLSQDK